MGWLVQKDMVQALLRAHLHQRQYVDQVQKVLKMLATEDGLQADHLELLWNLTEKARMRGHFPFFSFDGGIISHASHIGLPFGKRGMPRVDKPGTPERHATMKGKGLVIVLVSSQPAMTSFSDTFCEAVHGDPTLSSAQMEPMHLQ